MSEVGQKASRVSAWSLQTRGLAYRFAGPRCGVRFRSKADMTTPNLDVRFTPIADIGRSGTDVGMAMRRAIVP